MPCDKQDRLAVSEGWPATTWSSGTGAYGAHGAESLKLQKGHTLDTWLGHDDGEAGW